MAHTDDDAQVQRRISAAILRLQTRSPFFATLALFANIRLTSRVDIAATNGLDIFLNPKVVQQASSEELDGILLHEVLHTALRHVSRRTTRDRRLWNIAADISVNGMVAQQEDLTLLQNAIRDTSLEHLSVEEIYELLLKTPPSYDCTLLDLINENDAEKLADLETEIEGSFGQNPQVLETYWRDAMNQAIAVSKSTQSQSSIPAGFNRELDTLIQPQLDWRSYLWRYLVRTPTDFSGFDRRFIGRKLYLETLAGESVQVYVAIDTSGSICDRDLQSFLSELRGILQSYPHLECELYYADAALYGPYPLTTDSPLPKPIGGGGTSFVPFFQTVGDRQNQILQTGVCVYLTDGYGRFPTTIPNLPVLWVVTPGGLDTKRFPFGEAVKLLASH